MNTVLVVILVICKISSSAGENCPRYYSKHDVTVEIDGCDSETFLEQEIYSAQCTEYCERDPQCKAVIAETKYKTRVCCLLYNDPVVMVTGTGTGNHTLYYKPGTKLETRKPYDIVPGYTIYEQRTCEIGIIQHTTNISDIGQCTGWCNGKLLCAGFFYTKEECFFFDDTCTVNDQVEDQEATTYVKIIMS